MFKRVKLNFRQQEQDGLQTFYTHIIMLFNKLRFFTNIYSEERIFKGYGRLPMKE